ncbi:MAG: RluA family pseudouridine synthase [Chthoniobacterales bacterium]|nr:RluA family pseudouridine synthase [Chthoniobacterales bacterium]
MRNSSTVETPAELLPYLFAHWPEVKKKQVRTWLKYQAVTVNGRPTSQFNHPLRPGDKVAIRSDRFAIPRTSLPSGMKVYFEDATLIVIEKPENLLSVASRAEEEKTAYFQLTAYLRRGKKHARDRIWIVHRLDRETSGLMVFAKTSEAKETLQSGWDQVVKRYEAVVEGTLPKEQGTLESHLNETNPFRVYSAPQSGDTRHAVTHFRVLQRSAKRTLVDLTLETGRRHQIRVQLADLGHPIVGDEKYGGKTNPAHRLALHSCGLKLVHPATKEEMSFSSPLPKDLVRLI